MEKQVFDAEERIVLWSDVKRLYIALRKRLIKWAAMGAMAAFLYFGIGPTEYRAEASFREGAEKSAPENFLKEFMQGLAPALQPQAISLMDSRQVLRSLVEALGLQISSAAPQWSMRETGKRYWETFRTEVGLSPRTSDCFFFKDTQYEGAKPYCFHLLFTTPNQFTIYSGKRKRELGRGTVGEEVFLPKRGIRFTMARLPKRMQLGTSYPFEITHWASAAKGLQKQLHIQPDKANKSLIRLSISHRDGQMASRIVNGLMHQYQKYLKREYDHVAQAQLAYLEKRQEQTYEKMEELFDQHSAYLKESLGKEGFVGLDREGENLMRQLQEKVLAIEIELARFEEGKETVLAEEDAQMRDLKQQRDLLELSLSHSPQELWKAAPLVASRKEVLGSPHTPDEFEGIDLTAARQLFLSYNEKLDAAEAAMRHYAQLKQEIHRPDFDLASLSAVLPDPFCQKMIGEAGQLALQLKDETHRSSKEAGRWQEEILLQKKMLGEHLEQLRRVEELRAALVREKIRGLQKVSIDCLNQQLSVLQEQKSRSLQEKRSALSLEKSLLEKKIEQVRDALVHILPEKWRFENSLSFKSEMIGRVMRAVTEVAETKSIASHLHHVESKPLDLALVPTTPNPPHLLRNTLLAALLFPCFLFSFAFARQTLQGFPLTLEKLQALKLPALGSISSFCDGPSVEAATGPDLELFRKIALFAGRSRVIGLLQGSGPDYSYALCENLSRMSIRSVLVRSDFLSKYRPEDCPGLLQIWKGESEELPIRKKRGIDTITAGGFSPFGAEILCSESFQKLLEVLKKNYDQIFLVCRNPLSSVQSAAMLPLCDKVVVTISGEQTEELTPFIKWAYHEEDSRLTFIATA